LSIREHISETRPIYFKPNFAHVTYVCGSVLLWRRCDALCASGFMDESCLYIMARNRRRVSDSVAISMDLTPWRILKLTHQGAAPDWGRSLISTDATINTQQERQAVAMRSVATIILATC